MELDFGAIFSLLFSWQTLLGMLFGTAVGVIFGSIPGLTGVMAIAIFLPFTFSMDATAALVMLFSCFAGGCFGGSITAVLIGTPGTSAAAATLNDGYPMGLRGEGEKAITTALAASCVGGVVSALVLLLFAPVIAKWTLNFAPPEYFMLGIFGISVIAGLNEGNMLMGLVSGLAGILVALVGMDPQSGVQRFTFGNLNLYSGINIMPVVLGMFALVRIFQSFENRKDGDPRQKTAELKHSRLTGEEWKCCARPALTGSVIGSIIGIIPAAGTDIAAFIAYNMEKTFGKRRDQLGTGIPEGIAAPEAANNAVTASSLVPLLTLGIPGSGGAATLLGAFMMQGLAPGPYLFEKNGNVMYAIMFGFLLTNVMMYIVVKLSMRMFVQVTRVPENILMPCLVTICMAGAYCGNGAKFDIMATAVIGILAYLMTLLNIPMIPFILGFVLGPTIEVNFRKALIMSNGSVSIFFNRPLCIAFIILTVVMLAATKIMNRTTANQ